MVGKPQPFPNYDEELVDEQRVLRPIWHQFFVNLWQKLGGGSSTTATTVLVISPSGLGAPIEAILSQTGVLIGKILLDTAGGPAQPQAVGASPLVYTAVEAGNLVAFNTSSEEIGGAVQPQTPGASPWTYSPGQAGTLVWSAAQAELSRDGGANWYPVSLQGGALPLLAGDSVRFTWYNALTPPTVDWFPTTVLFGAKMEISRNGGVTWFTVGLHGGSIFLLIGDKVRVSWTTAGAPLVTFFPVA